MPAEESNAFLVFSLCGAVAAIWARYRHMPPGIGRQQIRWALFGFGASIAALGVLILLQAAETHALSFAAWFWLRTAEGLAVSLITALLILGITVSLLRYRLYDADVTISRSVAYGAMTLGLLATFAGSEKVIEIMGEEVFGSRLGSLAGVLGAGAAAAMIGPFHHRVTHWAERRFRSGLAHLREGLPLLVGDMRETASPAELADVMLARVEKGVRARHGAVVTPDGSVLDVRDVDPATVSDWLTRNPLPTGSRHSLHCERSDRQFPLRVPLHADGVGLVGWLLLGPRPDGSFYGREERAVLAEIADPIARALAIAATRETREAAQRAREDMLVSRLDALRRFVCRHFGIDEASALEA